MYSDLSINTLILSRNPNAKPHTVFARINVDLKDIMPAETRTTVQKKVIEAVDTLCTILSEPTQWSSELNIRIRQLQTSLINIDYKVDREMWKVSVVVHSLIFSLLCYKTKSQSKFFIPTPLPDRIDHQVHSAFAKKRKLNFEQQIRRLNVPTSIGR